jgi:antirestriction protein ArdC
MTLPSSPQTSVSRRDLYQQVTDTIFKQLDAGTIPWQQPWKSESQRLLNLPQNSVTSKRYRGINILLLWSSALEQNFQSPEWASFKQWKLKGEAIRKGEKGSMIVYYDTFEKEVDGEIKNIPFLKMSTVFNRCQLVGYVPEQEIMPETTSLFERLSLVEEFVKNTNAVIEHNGDQACYIPSIDKIHMPLADTFVDTQDCNATENYYATLHHELVHWTGSTTRLNRNMGKKFGDISYAAEELVAELGAAFLCADFGLQTVDKGNHASYIDHWRQVLSQDKHCLIAAASEASKAVDYLQGLQPELTS